MSHPAPPTAVLVGMSCKVADLVVHGAGSLYVADTGNNRVLKYVPGP